MTAPGITVVVLTYNEEDNISNCLQHLTWADRLIIVDSGSTDRTVENSGVMFTKIAGRALPPRETGQWIIRI